MAKYIFIDTETTGLDPQVNVMTEIALLALDENVDGMYEVARYHFNVPKSNTGQVIDITAMQVNDTSIQEYLLSDSTNRKELATSLADFLRSYVNKETRFIGHNVKFDIEFMKKFLMGYGINIDDRIASYRNIIDTKQIAWFLDDAGYLDLKGKFSLNDLLVALGLPPREDTKHNAAEDMILTAEAYFRMRDLLEGAYATS